MRQDEEPVVNKTITDRCLCEPDILYWRGGCVREQEMDSNKVNE